MNICIYIGAKLSKFCKSAVRGPVYQVPVQCWLSCCFYPLFARPRPTPASWENRGAGRLEIEVRVMVMPTFPVGTTPQV